MARSSPGDHFIDLNLLPVSLHIGHFHGEMRSWGFIAPERGRWRNYLHTHSFFKVCYAFQGGGVFHIQDATHEIRAGEVFIAKPGDLHEILSSGDAPLGLYFWSYTLVPGQGADPAATSVDALLTAFMAATRTVGYPSRTMQSALELLTEEIAQKEPGYGPIIEGQAAKLVIDTARAIVDVAQIPSDPLTGPAKDHAEVVAQQIARYLRDNCGRPLSLRDVAAQVHLSKRHINRVFHRKMGISIMEYLTSVRMDHAAHLLLERHRPTKEVAHAVGYPDVRYFITVFHRRMGLTPAAFRRQGGTRFLRTP